MFLCFHDLRAVFEVGGVQEACAFLGDGMARLDQLEEEVHGRQRTLQDEMELYFGVMVEDMGTKWDMDGYGEVHSHGGYPKNA